MKCFSFNRILYDVTRLAMKTVRHRCHKQSIWIWEMVDDDHLNFMQNDNICCSFRRRDILRENRKESLGHSRKFHYSLRLFGQFWLAWLLATASETVEYNNSKFTSDGLTAERGEKPTVCLNCWELTDVGRWHSSQLNKYFLKRNNNQYVTGTKHTLLLVVVLPLPLGTETCG